MKVGVDISQVPVYCHDDQQQLMVWEHYNGLVIDNKPIILQGAGGQGGARGASPLFDPCILNVIVVIDFKTIFHHFLGWAPPSSGMSFNMCSLTAIISSSHLVYFINTCLIGIRDC